MESFTNCNNNSGVFLRIILVEIILKVKVGFMCLDCQEN